jgi:hypothetical protein
VCESGGVAGKEQLRVTFPADGGFSRIGRVAAAGLALRLGYDVGTVERLRLAVDAATAELSGAGRITLVAAWDPSSLTIELTNPDAGLDVERQDRARQHLSSWVGEPHVDRSRLRLVIPAG